MRDKKKCTNRLMIDPIVEYAKMMQMMNHNSQRDLMLADYLAENSVAVPNTCHSIE